MFRAGYSAIDNLFSLSSVIQKYLSRCSGQFNCRYVDLKKSIQYGGHKQPFKSLMKKGVHDNF